MDTIFYSWQSDLPNKTNRGFIQKALENSAKKIRQDESIKIEPVVDRDTVGVPGSPDIAYTILAKIDSCSVFVADVSIINRRSTKRKTSNPNVLIELGYALKTLGESRIVMVQNTAFGSPELLPFDLRMKRVVTYRLTESVSITDKLNEKKSFVDRLTTVLKSIFQKLEKESQKSGSGQDPITVLKDTILDESKKIVVDELIRKEVEKAHRILDSENEKSIATNLTQEELIQKIDEHETSSKTLEKLMVVMGQYAPDFHLHHLTEILERLTDFSKQFRYYNEGRYYLRFYSALRILYTAGLSAFFNNRYDNLKALLIDPVLRVNSETIALIQRLNGPTVFPRNIGQMIHGMDRNFTPISDHLEKSLRNSLSQIIINDDAYLRTFDQFEYLLALTVGNHRIDNPNMFWVPVGCFGWRRKSRAIPELLKQAENEKENWALIKAGFFNSSFERFEKVNQEVQNIVNNLGWY